MYSWVTPASGILEGLKPAGGSKTQAVYSSRATLTFRRLCSTQHKKRPTKRTHATNASLPPSTGPAGFSVAVPGQRTGLTRTTSQVSAASRIPATRSPRVIFGKSCPPCTAASDPHLAGFRRAKHCRGSRARGTALGDCQPYLTGAWLVSPGSTSIRAPEPEPNLPTAH